ncbi:hypothetical protein IV203_018084 [Nitzschia inconspicua]|uniref:Uncharacterized protein n=1 Tax=Nitzschia inconspicua TaxID=303405 RepID=A0A9K3M141_9STRA|nr:hypothetical protein IV203_018084 [Nitzschia inconspicua]
MLAFSLAVTLFDEMKNIRPNTQSGSESCISISENDGRGEMAESHSEADCIAVASRPCNHCSVLKQIVNERSFTALNDVETEFLSDDDSIELNCDDYPQKAVFYLTKALQEVSITQSDTPRTLSSFQIQSFSSMPSLSTIIMMDDHSVDPLAHDDNSSLLHDSTSIMNATTVPQAESCVIVLDGCAGRERVRFSPELSTSHSEPTKKKDLRWCADGCNRRSIARSNIDSSPVVPSPTTTKSCSLSPPLRNKTDSSPACARRWRLS